MAQRVNFMCIYFFFWPHHVTCGILPPGPGTEPGSLVLKVSSPNHRTTGEFPTIKKKKINTGPEVRKPEFHSQLSAWSWVTVHQHLSFLWGNENYYRIFKALLVLIVYSSILQCIHLLEMVMLWAFFSRLSFLLHSSLKSNHWVLHPFLSHLSPSTCHKALF